MRKITEIIIHCSATPNGRYHNADDIHLWHRQKLWAGIGYHYVITPRGELEQGRPDYWVGAHARGHNKHSIGICMIGTDDYNLDQWSVLKKLLTKLSAKYIDAKIIGHNEISRKTCPGFDVQQWLNDEFYNGSV